MLSALPVENLLAYSVSFPAIRLRSTVPSYILYLAIRLDRLFGGALLACVSVHCFGHLIQRMSAKETCLARPIGICYQMAFLGILDCGVGKDGFESAIGHL